LNFDSNSNYRILKHYISKLHHSKFTQNSEFKIRNWSIFISFMLSKKTTSWLLVLFWLGVIFSFSSQPNLKSDLPIFRKIAHISEYFVLFYLTFRALRRTIESRPLVLSFVFSFAVAIADEAYQTTIAGRLGSIVDVGIDTVGIIVGVLLVIASTATHRRINSAK
jgi:VanZ family protein